MSAPALIADATLAAGPSGTPTWLLIATIVVGNAGFAGVLITGILNRRKTAAEAKQAGAAAGKTDAETTEALVRTSLSLLEPYTRGLKDFSEEAARLREENGRLSEAQKQTERENLRLRAEQDDLRRVNAELRQQVGRLQGRVDALAVKLHDFDVIDPADNPADNPAGSPIDPDGAGEAL